MNIKWKSLAIIESLIIIALLSILAALLHYSTSTNGGQESKSIINNKTNLLSPRVYAGILEPKSFMIVNYAPLKLSIESFIKKNNLNMSVYMQNLRDGALIGVDYRKGYPPASLDKVHTAILIMKRAERGELSLDTPIPINDSLRSSAYGSLYKTQSKELPLNVLMEKMLRESDDTAFKILANYVDPNDKSFLLSYLDYYSRDSTDNTFPGEDRELGLVTPKSMYNVFSSLYFSTVLEPEDSEYILSLLTDTVFDINKIAELPGNVTVAQKFALKYTKADNYLHSCGIMYIDERRLFYCVMTEGIDKKNAEAVIGAVVNSIYTYTINTRLELDKLKDEYHFG